MAAQLCFEDVQAGMALPEKITNASRAQLFLYSAATWNPHRIHYDREYARSEGLPDVVVHGPLQGAWLSQYVTDWAGPRGRVLQLSWQNRRSAVSERDLRFRGRVSRVYRDGGANLVELEVWEEDDQGQVLMPGTARVALPSRT